jgi:hypothetical protein
MLRTAALVSQEHSVIGRRRSAPSAPRAGLALAVVMSIRLHIALIALLGSTKMWLHK